jgi:hypothetical protein
MAKLPQPVKTRAAPRPVAGAVGPRRSRIRPSRPGTTCQVRRALLRADPLGAALDPELLLCRKATGDRDEVCPRGIVCGSPCLSCSSQRLVLARLW